MSISDEQYVSLITFTKDGSPKPTPVWIVDLGMDDHGASSVGFTTWADSWKARRIRNDPAVTLQPCDQRGNVTEGSPVVSGTGRIGTPTEFERVAPLVKEKYGAWVTVIKVMNSIRSTFGKGGQSNAAFVIILD